MIDMTVNLKDGAQVPEYGQLLRELILECADLTDWVVEIEAGLRDRNLATPDDAFVREFEQVLAKCAHCSDLYERFDLVTPPRVKRFRDPMQTVHWGARKFAKWTVLKAETCLLIFQSAWSGDPAAVHKLIDEHAKATYMVVVQQAPLLLQSLERLMREYPGIYSQLGLPSEISAILRDFERLRPSG